MAAITTSEAAERLGVEPDTLVAWLNELPIPQGADGFDDAAMEVLEAVRAMKAFDHGDQTIRRMLIEEPAPAPVPAGDLDLDLVALIRAVTEALEPLQRRIMELGEEKARAHAAMSREVGRLEAENGYLKADHARMAEDLAASRAREAGLEDLLAATHQRIAAMERALGYRWWNPLTWK
jgi:DNA-binding transcriptional MerR regulator